jgi:hypothetical protein
MQGIWHTQGANNSHQTNNKWRMHYARELDAALEHALEGPGQREGNLDEDEAGEEGLGELRWLFGCCLCFVCCGWVWVWGERGCHLTMVEVVEVVEVMVVMVVVTVSESPSMHADRCGRFSSASNPNQPHPALFPSLLPSFPPPFGWTSQSINQPTN